MMVMFAFVMDVKLGMTSSYVEELDVARRDSDHANTTSRMESLGRDTTRLTQGMNVKSSNT